MLKYLGLDGWQAWDYAIARLYRQTETAEGVTKSCDVCGSPNGKEHGGTCPIATAESLMFRELRKCQAGHRKPVVYVAGRFRSTDGWKINENVFAAEKAGREVAALGAMPLIPHSIGAHMAGTEDDSFWLTGTLELMRRCDVVLVLPGYQESQGTRGEIVEAQRIGMPVIMPSNGAPGWDELRIWLKKPMMLRTAEDTAQRPTGVDLVVDGACLFEGQTLMVEREHGKAEVALHTVDKSGESYIWLKDDSAVCKLISALSLVAESDKPVALMAEIAEKWQTKRLLNARDQADQMLAELGIELGQRDGETLLAAARRVRETGTYAEVERLTQLLEATVAALQEARDRHDKVATVAEKLHKQVEDQTRELDELRARYEDTKRQNEVAGQELDKRDHEALAFAAKRVVHGAEVLRQQTKTLQVERDELLAKWEQTKGQLASERAEHKEHHQFLRSLVNAGPDEALDVAIGKALVKDKQLTTERDSLRAEVTMLREELKTQKAQHEENKKEQAKLAVELGQRLLWVNEKITSNLGQMKQNLERVSNAVMQSLDAVLSTPSEQIKGLQAALAEEKKQREGFVASLCAELGVQGGERTVMAALEQLKLRAGRKDTMHPYRMVYPASAGLVRALPQVQPSDAAPSSEASHITQAGEAEVTKALTRPADSSCTCHLDAPCSHCTWYSDRGLNDPNEVGVGLVMQD